MKGLLIALQFLTILPVRIRGELKDRGIAASLIYFPVVGLFIGLLLAGVSALLSGILPPLLLSVILAGLWLLITGGMHLDGTADTFDALGSGKPRQAMLEIMRDSRIGAFGMAAVVFLILFKVFALHSLGSMRTGALIVAPVLGRFSVTLPIFLFSYPRESGKAKAFFDNIRPKTVVIAAITALVIAGIALGVKGVLFFPVICVLAALFSFVLSRTFGGITGDNLGAIIEFTEAVTLIILAI